MSSVKALTYSVNLDDSPEDYLRGVLSQARGVQDGGAVRFTYDPDGGPHSHGLFFTLEVRTGSCFLRLSHGGDREHRHPRDRPAQDRWRDPALSGGGWDGEQEAKASHSLSMDGYPVSPTHVIRIGKPVHELVAADLEQALMALVAARVMSA